MIRLFCHLHCWLGFHTFSQVDAQLWRCTVCGWPMYRLAQAQPVPAPQERGQA
jgi:hypothetical protein